ncbi:MAG: CDP-diacylglycerol--glycerol-3-phosphate 3-phosphatidyltransferase [Planctomycetales bacterium]
MPLIDERDPAENPAELSAGAAGRARLGSPLNVPNVITFSRLLLAILLFWLIDRGNHWVAASVVFIVAAATDALDGYIARRYGLVTVVGRILDPFVDKVIIGGAFVFLAVQSHSGVTPWMAIIVLGREMFITSLRSFLESEGRDFSATASGKIKMILQCAAVAASLLSLEYREALSATSALAAGRDALLWGAVGATLYSGLIYIVRAVQLFRGR